MNGYDHIANIIRHIDEHLNEQPELATLADHTRLSRPHFHRLFSDRAAITPGDFRQCLTLSLLLSHVRELLRVGKNLLAYLTTATASFGKPAYSVAIAGGVNANA
jgi:AraC-like DNA-binding protein